MVIDTINIYIPTKAIMFSSCPNKKHFLILQIPVSPADQNRPVEIEISVRDLYQTHILLAYAHKNTI